jgi:hypothetical protein
MRQRPDFAAAAFRSSLASPSGHNSNASFAVGPPSPLFRPGSLRGGSAAPLREHERAALPGLSSPLGRKGGDRRPSSGGQFLALPPSASPGVSASSPGKVFESAHHEPPSPGFSTPRQRGARRAGASGRTNYDGGGSGELKVPARLSRTAGGLELGGGFGGGLGVSPAAAAPSAWAVDLMQRYNLSPAQRPGSRRGPRSAASPSARKATAGRPLTERGGLSGLEPPQWQ